jgi:hypothetical protein
LIPITTYVVPPFEHQPFLYILFGIGAAAVLCWCRSRWQIVYGSIEIVVGLFLMILSLQVKAGGFSSGFSSGFDTFRYAVTITTYLGGIFVMVRGCDNIKQGGLRGGGRSWPQPPAPEGLFDRFRMVRKHMRGQ